MRGDRNQGEGDTDTIVKIKTPKSVTAWRTLFSGLLLAVGYGTYFAPPRTSEITREADQTLERVTKTMDNVSTIQLPRLGEAIGELKQSVALLRQSMDERNTYQKEKNQDFDERLRRLDRRTPQP